MKTTKQDNAKKAGGKGRPNIAKISSEFIGKRPGIKNNLKSGLVNFSALAREIIEKQRLKEGDFDAVLVAIRRYSEKIQASKSEEGKIIELLKKSSVEVKNKVCAVVVSEQAPVSQLIGLMEEIHAQGESFNLIQGSRASVIITSMDFLGKIEKIFQGFILSKSGDLVQITVKSKREIESTPGVISFLYSSFSEAGINILETMSSWTDTLFVIEEKDLAKAMGILKF